MDTIRLIDKEPNIDIPVIPDEIQEFLLSFPGSHNICMCGGQVVMDEKIGYICSICGTIILAKE